MSRKLFPLVMIAAIFGMLACQNTSDMETVEEAPVQEEGVPSLFGGEPIDSTATHNSHHHSEVEEVLKDGRYDILKVREGEIYTWIIVRSSNVVVGDHVDYHEGLVKEGYRSTNLDRVFDKVVLVSQLEFAHGDSKHEAPPQKASPTTSEAKNALSTTEFLAKAASLEGKRVRVKGVVVKVNAHIMKRHWIHLSDGKGGKSDVVVTTQTIVPVGHTVVFEGKVSRNKDFGSGYRFEILLEDAKAL